VKSYKISVIRTVNQQIIALSIFYLDKISASSKKYLEDNDHV